MSNSLFRFSANNFDQNSTDQKQKNSKINVGKISLFNTANRRRSSTKFTKVRRRSLIGLTLMDLKNIEEEIKNKIVIMKYYVEEEMKKVYGDTLLEKFLNTTGNGNNENYKKNLSKNEYENFNKTTEKNITIKSDEEENEDSNNENPLLAFAAKYLDKKQQKENLSKIEHKTRFKSFPTNIYLNRDNSPKINTNKEKEKEKNKDEKNNTIVVDTMFKLKKI